MSSVINPFYGWELLYDSMRNSIHKKADLIIAFTHFLLTKQFDCGALPLYPDGSQQKVTKGSEKLPHRWNRDKDKYNLNYVCNDKMYLLSATLTGRDLCISLKDLQGNGNGHGTNIIVQPDHYVACIRGALCEVMPAADMLMDRLNDDLIRPILTGAPRNTFDLASTPEISITNISTNSFHFDKERPSIKQEEPERAEVQVEMRQSTVPRFQSFPSHTDTATEEYSTYNSAVHGELNEKEKDKER